jgi:hypothetical protein
LQDGGRGSYFDGLSNVSGLELSVDTGGIVHLNCNVLKCLLGKSGSFDGDAINAWD